MKKIHEMKNNKNFNATINKVHAEIDSAKKVLGQWNMNWTEKYSEVYCYDLQFKLEDDIAYMESMYDYLYDLSKYYDDSIREGQAIERVRLEDDKGEEYLCEFRQLDWILSNKKILRSFTFYNTGGIKYSQVKKRRVENDQSFDYYAAYDVNNNELSLRVRNNEDDLCFINSDVRKYNFDNKMILEDEECLSLSETKEDGQTLRIELDKAGNVVRKHLIIGDYYYLVEGDDLVSAFVSDNDLEINDELYLMVLYLINGFEIGKIDDNQLFDYINSVKVKMINAIKSIKGDVPADELMRRLDIALSMISTKRRIIDENVSLSKKR